MDDLALARALHIFGVVIWIGGVSMATTVAPAIRSGNSATTGADRKPRVPCASSTGTPRAAAASSGGQYDGKSKSAGAPSGSVVM